MVGSTHEPCPLSLDVTEPVFVYFFGYLVKCSEQGRSFVRSKSVKIGVVRDSEQASDQERESTSMDFKVKMEKMYDY